MRYTRRGLLRAAAVSGLLGLPATATAQSATGWPMFGHDPGNTAHAVGTFGPREVQEFTKILDGGVDTPPAFVGDQFYHGNTRVSVWNRPVDPAVSESFRRVSPPEGLSYNTVAVTGTRLIVSGSTDAGGHVTALSLSDLSTEWTTRIGSFPFTNPTVAGGIIYQVDGDGVLHALDEANGDALWTYDIGGQNEQTPAVSDDRVYITRSRGLACVDTNGTEVWTRNGEYSGSAVVDDGTVFALESDAFEAIDAASGDIEWSHETATTGIINTRCVATTPEYVCVATLDALRAFDRSSGDQRWSVELSAGPISLTDRTVYAVTGGGSSGTLNALDADDGERLWRQSVDYPIMTEPIVLGGRLYVGLGDGLYRMVGSREQTESQPGFETNTTATSTTPSTSPPAKTSAGGYWRRFLVGSGLGGIGVVGGYALLRKVRGDRSGDEADKESPTGSSVVESGSDSPEKPSEPSDSRTVEYPSWATGSRESDVSVEAFTVGDSILTIGSLEARRATGPDAEQACLWQLRDTRTIDRSYFGQVEERIRAWSALPPHRGVAAVLENGSTPVPWAAFAFPGMSIGELRRHSHQDVQSLLIDLCEAVHHLHRHGVTHGYLRPEMVRIVNESPVIVGVPEPLDGATPATRYAAPEAVDGTPSHASDCYAIAAVGLDLLIDGRLADETAASKRERVDDLDLPSGLAQGLRQGLAPALANRPETVLHLRDLIQAETR